MDYFHKNDIHERCLTVFKTPLSLHLFYQLISTRFNFNYKNVRKKNRLGGVLSQKVHVHPVHLKVANKLLI